VSYPPPHHLLRDLGFRGTHSPEVARNTLEITAGLLDSKGARLGALATLVDVSGAGVALHAVAPDWIATADLQLHLIRPVTSGTVSVECRPLRVGAGRVVIDATLTDENNGICGTGRMAFSRLPGSATTASVEQVTNPEPTPYSLDGGTAVIRPLVELCGIEPVGPGQALLPKTPYVQNSFGTVNGGVLALAAESAAVSACGGGHARDLQIHYLEQIGDGPVAITAEVVRDGENSRLCTVRIEDRSSGRLAAIADVIVSD